MRQWFLKPWFPRGVVALFWFVGIQTVLGQSNFIPLEPGDLMVKEDRWMFSPGIQLSGDYRFSGSQLQSKQASSQESIGRDWEIPFLEHDLRLRMRSTMHRHLSINLELAVGNTPLNDPDVRHAPVSQRQLTPSSQIESIEARQAYLEYYPNPHGSTRVGKYEISLGDHRGKVLSGILTGISHACHAGTWCYEVGAFKMGKNPADWIYYGSLDYPLFLHKTQEGAISNRMNIEIFRMLYTERNIPLGKNNGPTARDTPLEKDLRQQFLDQDLSSFNQLKQQSYAVFDQEGRPLYYDAFRQEYFGLRSTWETTHWLVYQDVVANQGGRRYHLERNEDGIVERPSLGKNSRLFKNDRRKESVAAVAAETEVRYQFTRHQFHVHFLKATGDRQRQDSLGEGNDFIRGLHGYYEILPGTFHLTNFYFNGNGSDLTGGTGLGRSINNTLLLGFRYRFSAAEAPFFYEIGLFDLKKNQSVLNEQQKRVSDIGIEWDNTFGWTLDKQLQLSLEGNYFQTREAFSYADSVAPAKKQDSIIHVAAQIRYSF